MQKSVNPYSVSPTLAAPEPPGTLVNPSKPAFLTSRTDADITGLGPTL